MSQPLTCPHSSIGICVPCYIARYTAGETMPDPDPEVCICGRGMTNVLTCNIDDDTGVVVRWCGGCGVIHVHDRFGPNDSRWIPNPKYIGQR